MTYGIYIIENLIGEKEEQNNYEKIEKDGGIESPD
jgi:hypothetical protein